MAPGVPRSTRAGDEEGEKRGPSIKCTEDLWEFAASRYSAKVHKRPGGSK